MYFFEVITMLDIIFSSVTETARPRLVPVVGHLRVEGGGRGVGGGRLHVLVAQELRRELGLGLGYGRACRAVDAVHLGHEQHVGDGGGDEADGGEHGDDAGRHARRERVDACDQAAGASTTEPNRLHHSDQYLEQEYEEEDHEVEGRIASKRLVDRPVPAQEAEGGQQYEIQDGQSECLHSKPREHEGHCRYDVH